MIALGTRFSTLAFLRTDQLLELAVKLLNRLSQPQLLVPKKYS